jgi:hypothetical protein
MLSQPMFERQSFLQAGLHFCNARPSICDVDNSGDGHIHWDTRGNHQRGHRRLRRSPGTQRQTQCNDEAKVSDDGKKHDAELLASMLHQVWYDANNASLPSNEVWYRVAERATEFLA